MTHILFIIIFIAFIFWPIISEELIRKYNNGNPPKNIWKWFDLIICSITFYPADNRLKNAWNLSIYFPFMLLQEALHGATKYWYFVLGFFIIFGRYITPGFITFKTVWHIYLLCFFGGAIMGLIGYSKEKS